MVYDKVIAYCEENALSTMAFEKKCGLSNGIVGKWKENNYNPSLGTLVKISIATGVPIEKWLEN